MDLAQAVVTHQQWKTRLSVLLNGKNKENLDPGVICRDDQCELGKWIHTGGRNEFGARAEFADLRESHAKFHACAGQAAGKALSGDRDGVKKILDGPFRDLTMQVVMAINRLKTISDAKAA